VDPLGADEQTSLPFGPPERACESNVSAAAFTMNATATAAATNKRGIGSLPLVASPFDRLPWY
jgi:hypothetical protein